MRTSFSKLFDEIGTVDQVGIEERVAKFTTRSIKKGSKLWGLKTAVSMVDLTTLEGKDTPGKVASLCQKARRPSFDPDVPPVAAVCIYPFLVKYAARWLADTAIKVASVAAKPILPAIVLPCCRAKTMSTSERMLTRISCSTSMRA